MIDTFAIATPIDPRRTWTLPMYKDGVGALEPPPQAVGIVTSREVFDEWFADDDKYVFVAEHPGIENMEKELERIAHCRKKLRDWFWEKRNEEYLFWLDSDVEVFRNTFTDIRKAMEYENCLMFSNGIQGRRRARAWKGLACTVVHADVANLGSFDMRKFRDDDGNITSMSEDIFYYANYTGSLSSGLLSNYKPSYDKVRVGGNVTYAEHHMREGANNKDFVYEIDSRYEKI